MHFFFYWLTGVFITLFLKYWIDLAENGLENKYYAFLIYSSIFFILYELYVVFITKSWWVSNFWLVRLYIYKKYFNKFIKLDNNHYEKLWTWKAIAIIWKWVNNWGSLIDWVIMSWTETLIWFVFAFVMISQVSYLLAFLFILLLFLGLLLWIYLNNKVIFYRKKRNDHDNYITKESVKIIMTKYEILQTWKIDTELNKIKNNIEKSIYYNYKMSLPLVWFFVIPDIIIFIILILVFIYFWNLYFSWDISLSVLVWISGSIIFIQKVLSWTMHFFKDVTKNFAEVEKLWDFFDNTPEMKWYDTWKEFKYKNWKIEIENLTYWYSEDKPVFKNFNLKLKWWKVTAFVWNSWSWKSTLVKLIAGYISWDNWKIIVDEQEISKISLKSYYKNIWYLTQDPSVFDWTILDNLTYWMTDDKVGNAGLHSLQDKLEKVLKQSKCEFIYDLENWLDTEIWERWVRLSWWQKQRLAIAKIFLKDPKIIILDEPTSALDSFSEEQITKAMHNLFENRTVIVIAHRLQTVKEASDIILFENGEIKERWTHKELVYLKGQYNKMLELQSGF